MINFWGDFTFFLFSFPSSAQPLAAKSSLPQGLFLFSAFFLENGHLAQKTIVYARFSLASQEAAPALPAQRGTKDASGLCMGQAKSSKGGVRPQHFSVREGYKERFDNKRSLLEAQPLTRSWTYRQARAASPEPASLSWAGNPNAECGRQSTAENLLGGKYIE